MDRMHASKIILLLVLIGLAPLFLPFSLSAQPVKILPDPFADRTFQFVRVEGTFAGTPLLTQALVPHVTIVVGEKESPQLFLAAASMAYMLGQWTHDPGTSVEAIRSGAELVPVRTDRSLREDDLARGNVILLGRNNTLEERIQASSIKEGSVVQVFRNGLAPGRDTLLVSDDVAASYLANRRLYFKSGAFKGFYHFVTLGLLIRKGDLSGAHYLLDDPGAVRGCGKPVVLAAAMGAQLPPEMLAMAQKRNQIVFQDLRQALRERERGEAVQHWQEAMATCYACHQGQSGTPRYRQFLPNAEEHGYHQKIAEAFAVDCDACHRGPTEIRGYGE